MVANTLASIVSSEKVMACLNMLIRIYIWVRGRWIGFRVRDCISMGMGIDIWGDLLMGRNRGMGCIIIGVGLGIRASGMGIRRVARGLSIIGIIRSMRVIGLMGRKMVKVRISMRMAINTMVDGPRTKKVGMGL